MARTDTERLDWLDSKAGVSVMLDISLESGHYDAKIWDLGRGEPLRETIDAWMDEEEK